MGSELISILNFQLLKRTNRKDFFKDRKVFGIESIDRSYPILKHGSNKKVIKDRVRFWSMDSKESAQNIKGYLLRGLNLLSDRGEKLEYWQKAFFVFLSLFSSSRIQQRLLFLQYPLWLTLLMRR